MSRVEIGRVELALTVRDLTKEDLPNLTWSGSPTHIKAVEAALARGHDAVDYLAICPPSTLPIAKGGVDYELTPDAGVLWQLAVHPTLQGCGIGTLLIKALEQRIVARGLSRAELLVEYNNPRAKALYERLGYTPLGQRAESWDAERNGGSGEILRYETVCDILSKAL